MPVLHRKVSPAADIGEPNTIMVSDWNDNMIGEGGGGDLLPLLRKLTHMDGMDFAASAQEARNGIDVYSKTEVNNLISGVGIGIPGGGLTNQMLTKYSDANHAAFWSNTLRKMYFQALDGSNVYHSMVWSDTPNVLNIGDNTFRIDITGDTFMSNWGTGHRFLEIQTDGGYVPHIRFHRRNVDAWSIGVDGYGFVLSKDFGLGVHRFRIDGTGNAFIPQGSYYYGGGRALIGADSTTTYIPGPLVVMNDTLFAQNGLNVSGSVLNAINGMAIWSNTIFQSNRGAWIAYDRSSDGELIYAYNTNDCFNEAGGRTLFHRDIRVDGTTVVNNLTVNGTTNFGGPVNFVSGGAIIARAIIWSTEPMNYVQSGFDYIDLNAGNPSQVRFRVASPPVSGQVVTAAVTPIGDAASYPVCAITYESASQFVVTERFNNSVGGNATFTVMVTG